MEHRQIGNTGIEVSPIAFGGWPITGINTFDVNDTDSLAAVESCFDNGINFIDTAYMYGPNGESEKLIAQALGNRRDEMIIATKGGFHWNDEGRQDRDGRPETLKRQCEISLQRLNTDRVELLYLHTPDPNVPPAESAGALKELMEEGKTLSVGASNMTVSELEEIHAVCPISAYQPPYNMLVRDIENDTLPWCRERNISVMVYWPIMLGLLAGKLKRDRYFPPEDNRAKYPMFQGEEYQKNLDLVDKLKGIAEDAEKTVVQLVLNWTIHQPGITVALTGAKRPAQNNENAGAMGWKLTPEQFARIDKALKERGTPNVRKPSASFSSPLRRSVNSKQ